MFITTRAGERQRVQLYGVKHRYRLTSSPSESYYREVKTPKQFCQIDVTCQIPGKVCGKLIILLEVGLGNLERYGLVVELQTQLFTSFDGPQQEFLSPENNLTGSNLGAGFNSGIYTLVPTTSGNPSTTGKIEFPFQLVLPSNKTLASSISSCKIGKVVHFLVAYLRSNEGYEELARRPLYFYGNHEILQVQRLMQLEKKLTVDSTTIRLTSPKRYYLPKEPVEFEICVIGNRSPITSLIVRIVRKITFLADGISKTQIQILDYVNYNKLTSRDDQIFAIGKLKLEKIQGSMVASSKLPIVPTYTEEGVGVKVQYFLEFNLAAKDLVIHESEEIIVGTRSCVGNSAGDEDESFMSRMRSSSVSVGSSLMSLILPSYSQLSSRKGSLVSLETLPPHYDEVCVRTTQHEISVNGEMYK